MPWSVTWAHGPWRLLACISLLLALSSLVSFQSSKAGGFCGATSILQDAASTVLRDTRLQVTEQDRTGEAGAF